jgi:hypothetical protein
LSASTTIARADRTTDVVQKRRQRDDNRFRPGVERAWLEPLDFVDDVLGHLGDQTRMLDVMLGLVAAQVIAGYVKPLNYFVTETRRN